MKPLSKPEETASLIASLLSDDAQMMTGARVDFDQNLIGAWD